MSAKEPEIKKTPLELLREELAAKEAAARRAIAEAFEKREMEMLDAKLKAMINYLPDQLLEVDIPFIGLQLYHTPSDAVYNQFMKGSGAIKGDLSKNTPEVIECLIAACVLYPEPAVALDELRKKNPHAKTLIGQRLLEVMKGQLLAEGK